jgi:hypothetical protein
VVTFPQIQQEGNFGMIRADGHESTQRVLRHAVGKSTLKEGFAIPREFEEWIGAPVRGAKREIYLAFDGQIIQATLRRIDNEKGSVQVKYETKEGEPFRTWLAKVFSATLVGQLGEYFEVKKTGEGPLQVSPFPNATAPVSSLHVEQWLFHGGADKLFEQDTPLTEIPAVVRAVKFIADEGQSHYNHEFSHSFTAWEWDSECRVIKELGLKADFAKDGVQAEVEFGNARTYYQDFVKFLLGNRYCGCEMGVLIVPSASFAKHLCEVGRQRAVKKGRHQYSGMINFDKVHREFKYLEFMLSMPIAIAGVSADRLSA